MLRRKHVLMSATALAVTLLAPACSREPEAYPPPEQRGQLTVEEVGGTRGFVRMNDPDAESYFVRDIRGLEGGQWRWTGQEPMLRFMIDNAQNQHLVVDFAVAGAVLEQTGPLTISTYVNDHLLDQSTYPTEGQRHFDKPVDPSWFTAGVITIVRLELDKVFVAPADGVKLGIILSAAGFEER